LPSREAEARPRGPGILLKWPGAFPEVRPGIFAVVVVSGFVVVVLGRVVPEEVIEGTGGLASGVSGEEVEDEK